MSPEQVRGEVCTQQSDLFSLGSVMYAMCTGVSPFQCESIYGTMQRVVNDVPTPIRDIAPETPEWLTRFIDVLINKDSRDRFQAASNVAELLEREIAYSQNPSASNKPDRTQYSIPTIRPMWMQQAFWLAVLPIALATIWLAFAFVPGVVKDQQQRAEVTQPGMTVSTVEILWNKDDVKGFSQTVYRLERQLFSTEPVPATDPWDREIRDLTRKMESFEERLP
jgi:serine/threonine protein kinase